MKETYKLSCPKTGAQDNSLMAIIPLPAYVEAGVAPDASPSPVVIEVLAGRAVAGDKGR